MYENKFILQLVQVIKLQLSFGFDQDWKKNLVFLILIFYFKIKKKKVKKYEDIKNFKLELHAEVYL